MEEAIGLLLLLLTFGKSRNGGADGGELFEQSGREWGWPYAVEHMAGGGYLATVVTDAAGTEHERRFYGADEASHGRPVFDVAVTYAQEYARGLGLSPEPIPWPAHWTPEGE